MTAIERDNPALKDVLPRDYARPALDKRRLGQLIDLVSNIRVGDQDARSRDVLGRAYEYFLSQFASAEGKKGGEFYTPPFFVKVLLVLRAPVLRKIPLGQLSDFEDAIRVSTIPFLVEVQDGPACRSGFTRRSSAATW